MNLNTADKRQISLQVHCLKWKRHWCLFSTQTWRASSLSCMSCLPAAWCTRQRKKLQWTRSCPSVFSTSRSHNKAETTARRPDQQTPKLRNDHLSPEQLNPEAKDGNTKAEQQTRGTRDDHPTAEASTRPTEKGLPASIRYVRWHYQDVKPEVQSDESMLFFSGSEQNKAKPAAGKD